MTAYDGANQRENKLRGELLKAQAPERFSLPKQSLSILKYCQRQIQTLKFLSETVKVLAI